MNVTARLLNTYFALSFVTLAAAKGQHPEQSFWDTATIQQQLSGPLNVRAKALKKVIASSELLTDATVRHDVVQVLNRENHNGKWEQLSERLDYEQYYGDALTAVQKIATEYHASDAWKALVSSVYNDDSPFALWLAQQPEAVSILVDFAHQTNDADTESRALFVLAEALARCGSMPSNQSCLSVETKRQEILQLLRQVLQNPLVSIAAVRGLGICGEEQDLTLLDKAKPAPSGQDSPEEGRHFFEQIVHKSQEQIESRLKQK